jgi:hypothetical protein
MSHIASSGWVSDETLRYFSQMLEDLRRQSPSDTTIDPRQRRLEKFFKDYAQFIVEGKGTDEESTRLESAIAWLKANNASFPGLPSMPIDWLKMTLRAVTPKYQKLVTEFMADHSKFVINGHGDRKKIARQIERLKDAGLLNESMTANFLRALSPSKTELERFVKPPWWKRMFV